MIRDEFTAYDDAHDAMWQREEALLSPDVPPTDPNANADEARDCQGEWERDVADSGDLR